jgi:mycothiol system anti-sigma-R factor
MNCEEALARLFEVVDKEITQSDKKEIMEHLEHCRHCMSRFDFEEMFKTFVAEKACIDCDSEKLKNKILEKLDQSRGSSR